MVVWDAIENIPGYSAELKLVENLGGLAAAEAIRAPFALGGKTDVLAMVREAGAETADVTTLRGKTRFPSIRVMMEAELRGWLPVMGVELGEEKIAAILHAAESALAPFTTREGAVDFDVTVHMTVARKR